MAEKPERAAIPKFEPEVVAAKKRKADPLAVFETTTSLDRVEHRGIMLYSRDFAAAEYALMMDGVDAMQPSYRNRLVAVFGRSGDFDFALEFDGFLTQNEMGAALMEFESAFGSRHVHRGLIAVVEGEPQIAIHGNGGNRQPGTA